MISPGYTARELKERLEVERAGRPFVVWRDDGGRQRIVALGVEAMLIGRRVEADIPLEWDREVSREHAVLEPVGKSWTIVDDGLSRNGTFVNGAKVIARRRLDPGDVIRCGGVDVTFCDPRARGGDETLKADDPAPAPRISGQRRRVLVALCRPLLDDDFAMPATNKQIAEEVFLSVDGVKTHLRALFEQFEVDDLPQTRKRVELARRARESGAVTARELRDPP